MTFTVTYRDRTGAKREEAIDAASRADCVAGLKARGITPLGVREGRAVRDRKGEKVVGAVKGDNGTARRPSRNSTFPILHFTFAIAAIAAIAFAWWWLRRDEAITPYPPDKPATTAIPKEVKPVPSTGSSKPLKKHVGGGVQGTACARAHTECSAARSRVSRRDQAPRAQEQVFRRANFQA